MKDKNSQLRTRIEVMMTSLGLTQRVAKEVAKTLVEIHFEEYAATREAEGRIDELKALGNFSLGDDICYECGFPQKVKARLQALTDTQGDCNCPMGSDQSQSKYTCPVHGDTQGDRKDTND